MAARVVSLTPAVFHLSDAVNHVSRTYGEAPIVTRGPRMRPLFDRVRSGIKEARSLRLDVRAQPAHWPGLHGDGRGAELVPGPDERLLVIRTASTVTACSSS